MLTMFKSFDLLAPMKLKNKSVKVDINLHFRAKMEAQKEFISLEKWLNSAITDRLKKVRKIAAI